MFGVTLCVTNPNRTELLFRRVTAALDAAGATLAEGASNAPVRLPPLASVPAPFAVTADARAFGPVPAGLARTGAVEYRLRGAVTLGGGPGLTVPFGRGGRLGLAEAGRALLADAAAPGGSRCGGTPLPRAGALM